jgi:DNA-binding transcriptional LysR family regulator
MSLQQASFRQLAAMVAVANEGSFGAAADELGLSQATVSQQVAALERLIGAELFDRPGGPRPVTLTPAGRVLLPSAEHMLGHVRAAQRDVDDALAGTAGRVSIGTFQSVSVHLLPRAVRALREVAPGITVALYEGPSSEGLIDDLLDDELDVTFIEGTYTDPRVDVTALGRDPYLLLLATESPLLTHVKKGAFPVEHLEGVDLIGQPPLTYQDDVDGILRGHGITPRYLFRTVDNGAVQAMVRSGVAPAIMPRLAVDMQDEGVVKLPLFPQVAARTISLAIRSGDNVLPAARAFMAAAVEAAGLVLEPTP